MFDNFENAQRSRKSRWIFAVLAGVVGLHGVLVAGLVVRGWWDVERLALPREGVSLAVAAPPPAPPAARKGSPAVSATKDVSKVVRRAPAETTQPVTLSEPAEATTGGGDGTRLGHTDGVGDRGPEVGCVGVTCADLVAEAPPEADPCATDPASCKVDDPVVPQVAVDKQRIAGDPEIRPDRETQLAMVRDRVASTRITVKMCLSASGSVRSLDIIRSTGYPAYDARVLREMRQWRYRPFEVNGVPTPVCTAITIFYKMS